MARIAPPPKPSVSPMAVDHIRYDILAQDALRGVVRRVLMDAATEESSQPQEDTAAGSESTRAAPEQKAVAPAIAAMPVVANPEPKPTSQAEPENPAGGEVVQLDRFRKK